MVKPAENMMEKIAFRMTLKAGCLDAYRQRHDDIWPELSALLVQSGIKDYSIHHDPQTNALFAVMWREKGFDPKVLPAQPIMQKWWAYMSDLMETEADNRPVEVPLETVFHLP